MTPGMPGNLVVFGYLLDCIRIDAKVPRFHKISRADVIFGEDGQELGKHFFD